MFQVGGEKMAYDRTNRPSAVQRWILTEGNNWIASRYWNPVLKNPMTSGLKKKGWKSEMFILVYFC